MFVPMISSTNILADTHGAFTVVARESKEEYYLLHRPHTNVEICLHNCEKKNCIDELLQRAGAQLGGKVAR